MTPARQLLALIALGTLALGLVWSGSSAAQPSGCYQGCQLPTTSMAVSRYVVCLGVRNGGTCTVCPSQQTGQAFQIATGKSLSCFKGCAKGYVWNAASQQCCPAPTQASAPVPPEAQTVDLIISPGARRGSSRVHDFFQAIKQRVQVAIALPMTQSEKWTVLRTNLDFVKKEAAAHGLVVTELGVDSNEIMRAAPDDTKLSAQQLAKIESAKAGAATREVKVVIGPPPALLENAIVGDARCPTEPVNISMPLGGSSNRTIDRTSIEIKRDKAIFRGPVKAAGPPLTLMWWPDGSMAGVAQDGTLLYSIRHLGGGVYSVIELDDQRMPREHAPAPSRLRTNDPNLRDDPLLQQGDASLLRGPPPGTRAPLRQAGLSSKQAQPGDIVIDVIVAYTPKAAAHYTDVQRELVELAIEEGNESFRLSGLGHIKLRLVHAYLTNYVEEGAHFDHVWRFADKGDGYMDEIHGLRNKYRGDVAILIVDDPQGCGLATRVHADAEEAFAVVHHECAATTYTVAHEIGHLIGARHDLAIDKVMTPFPYGHGYVNGTKWRDIMSYKESCGGCPRLPVWSSPKVRIEGEPAGTPELDNARVILEQAARVAAFR